MNSSDTPSHIAVFIPNLLGGGAERYAVNMSTALCRRGHQVDLVVGDARGSLRDYVSDDVRLIDFGHVHSSSNLLALIRYLRRERPDAILSAHEGANVLAVLARFLTRVPTWTVVSQHFDLVALVAAGRGRDLVRSGSYLKSAALGRLSRWACHRADAVVAVSRGVARSSTKVYRLPSESVTVIHNPVITPELIANFDGPFEHPGLDLAEAPVVIAIGRPAKIKRFDQLIEAFALVRQHTTAQLLILGEGPDRSGREALPEPLRLGPFFSMPGHVTNPLRLLKQASVFVLSSRFEALPTALIEAIYPGVPIVSTNCPSGPFEIIEGGAHGLLTAPDDPEALAAGIEAARGGDVPPPNPESWRRFELEPIAAKYERILLAERTLA